MRREIEVPPDPIGISAAEFNELRDLTIRCRNDAKAIFSTNSEGSVWPPTRYGKTPHGEREYISDMPYVLDQLRRSLAIQRMSGGRLFVDNGAYWKMGSTGNIEKVRFAEWRWKGDEPVREEVAERSREEIVASIMKVRAERKRTKKS